MLSHWEDSLLNYNCFLERKTTNFNLRFSSSRKLSHSVVDSGMESSLGWRNRPIKIESPGYYVRQKNLFLILIDQPFSEVEWAHSPTSSESNAGW